MKLLEFFIVIALVVLTFYLLIVGEGLLMPLVIAFVFWYLINLLANSFLRLQWHGHSPPGWARYALAIVCFLGLIWGLVEIVGMNIDEVVEVAPTYQVNLEERMLSLLEYFDIQEAQAPTLAQLTEIIDIRGIITVLAGSLTAIAANGAIILIYLIFMLVEQKSLDNKISALFSNPEKERDLRRLLRKIAHDVRTYIGIKMLTSALTGVLSYGFLKLAGVDFAEFWAILIFLLNFIPTIGSIIATVFPALITLVQFDNLTPFFIVIGGVTCIQFLIGNLLEPRLMGDSFNLSPVIILFNLSLWGVIWGIPGMFLCVPFLVIVMIVFSHLPQTRPIAVMLSRDGQLSTLPED